MSDKTERTEPITQDASEIQVPRLKEELNWYVSQRNTLIDLVKAQDEYAAVLIEEINSLIGLAAVHGWKSGNIEKGAMCRDEIAKLKEKLNQK